MAGLQYGLLLGLFMIAMVRLVPQPFGSMVLWFILAIHLSVMTVRIWQRMRLPYVTVAGILGVGGTLILGGTSWLGGYSFFTIPVIWPILTGPLVLAGSILLYIEARVHPEKWQVWHAAIRDSTVLDLLLGRHIPEVR